MCVCKGVALRSFYLIAYFLIAYFNVMSDGDRQRTTWRQREGGWRGKKCNDAVSIVC